MTWIGKVVEVCVATPGAPLGAQGVAVDERRIGGRDVLVTFEAYEQGGSKRTYEVNACYLLDVCADVLNS